MPAGYRLVSYLDAGGKPQAGVLIDCRVVNAEAILGAQGAAVIDILRNWDEAHPRLARASSGAIRLSPIAPYVLRGDDVCLPWLHLSPWVSGACTLPLLRPAQGSRS